MIDYTEDELRLVQVYAMVQGQVDKYVGWLSEQDSINNVKYVQKSPYDWQPNLRLDWELTGDVHKDSPELDFVSALILRRMLVDDMVDLIINGDHDNAGDPLLKTFNGAKKRGQKPVNLIFHSAVVYHEYKEVKDATEYTLYIQPHLTWE